MGQQNVLHVQLENIHYLEQQLAKIVQQHVMGIVLKQVENVHHVKQVMDILMEFVLYAEQVIIHQLEVQQHVKHAVLHHGLKEE